MIHAEIKKGKGIEELLIGYGGQAEVEREVKTSCATDFSTLLASYQTLLKQSLLNNRAFVRTPVHITKIITPNEIDLFLQLTIEFEHHDQYRYKTGIFISRLIQTSYEVGHNQFHLNTTNLQPINWLGSHLEGTVYSPLEIRITGDASYQCGFQSKHSIFSITGNAGYGCGEEAVKSIFGIQGITGRYCGHSAERSTFKTPNNETLERMEQFAPPENRIVFIDNSGAEHVIRDYHDKR